MAPVKAPSAELIDARPFAEALRPAFET